MPKQTPVDRRGFLGLLLRLLAGGAVLPAITFNDVFASTQTEQLTSPEQTTSVLSHYWLEAGNPRYAFRWKSKFIVTKSLLHPILLLDLADKYLGDNDVTNLPEIELIDQSELNRRLNEGYPEWLKEVSVDFGVIDALQEAMPWVNNIDPRTVKEAMASVQMSSYSDLEAYLKAIRERVLETRQGFPSIAEHDQALADYLVSKFDSLTGSSVVEKPVSLESLKTNLVTFFITSTTTNTAEVDSAKQYVIESLSGEASISSEVKNQISDLLNKYQSDPKFKKDFTQQATRYYWSMPINQKPTSTSISPTDEYQVYKYLERSAFIVEEVIVLVKRYLESIEFRSRLETFFPNEVSRNQLLNNIRQTLEDFELTIVDTDNLHLLGGAGEVNGIHQTGDKSKGIPNKVKLFPQSDCYALMLTFIHELGHLFRSTHNQEQAFTRREHRLLSRTPIDSFYYLDNDPDFINYLRLPGEMYAEVFLLQIMRYGLFGPANKKTTITQYIEALDVAVKLSSGKRVRTADLLGLKDLLKLLKSIASTEQGMPKDIG